MRKLILAKLSHNFGLSPSEASDEHFYKALVLVLKDILTEKYHRYRKEALKQGIQYLQNTFHAKEICTGVSVGNEQAKHVYKSLGFAETGLVEDGMEELKMTV